jgi:hypothetical protein
MTNVDTPCFDVVAASARTLFPWGDVPGSALITVSNFTRPGMEIEIQGIAVIGDGPDSGRPARSA